MITRPTRTGASAAISIAFVVSVVALGNEAFIAADWILPGLLMLLSGWALFFNLLTFACGSESEAVRVYYINDGPGPDRPMSPRLTSLVVALLWINAAAWLAVGTG